MAALNGGPRPGKTRTEGRRDIVLASLILLEQSELLDLKCTPPPNQNSNMSESYASPTQHREGTCGGRASQRQVQ
eukprot:566483-Rhodomonas_salina.3